MAHDQKVLTDAIGDAVAATRSEDRAALAEAIGAAIRNSRTDTIGLSPHAVARLEAPVRPRRWREVKCKSDETGATFVAAVVESDSMANGRIVEIKGYTHPRGIATYQSAGGLVPDGLQILRAGVAAPPEGGAPIPKHDLTPHYLHWRWTEYWQRDLRRIVGKELKRYLAIDSAAFETPWQEGLTRTVEEMV